MLGQLYDEGNYVAPEYKTDEEVIAKLKPIINNYTIKGFMGTWCGDSKRNVPRFYKILEETLGDVPKKFIVIINQKI